MTQVKKSFAQKQQIAQVEWIASNKNIYALRNFPTEKCFHISIAVRGVKVGSLKQFSIVSLPLPLIVHSPLNLEKTSRQEYDIQDFCHIPQNQPCRALAVT